MKCTFVFTLFLENVQHRSSAAAIDFDAYIDVQSRYLLEFLGPYSRTSYDIS